VLRRAASIRAHSATLSSIVTVTFFIQGLKISG
jgi:hypothetical protein